MTPILPTITEAGLAAVFNQSSTGFAAEITEIAVGDRGYTPSQTQEALHHEMARFPFADGVMTTPTQAHLTALDDTEREYWVREVGFYLVNSSTKCNAVKKTCRRNKPMPFTRSVV